MDRAPYYDRSATGLVDAWDKQPYVGQEAFADAITALDASGLFERIEELEAEVALRDGERETNIDEFAALLSRITELELALALYADGRYWPAPSDCDQTYAATFDRGRTARKALGR